MLRCALGQAAAQHEVEAFADGFWEAGEFVGATMFGVVLLAARRNGRHEENNRQNLPGTLL